MLDLLTRYFLANREVVIPGIGQLQYIQMPARFDAARQIMLPPSELFQWKPDGESTLSPQGLMGFLSRQMQWSEEESFERVHVFCQKIKNELNEHGQWRWTGIGKLVCISEGTYGFVPDDGLEQYNKVIAASRVQHTGRVHAMLVGNRETNTDEMKVELETIEPTVKKSRWWIPFLIIGLMAVALIIMRLAGLV